MDVNDLVQVKPTAQLTGRSAELLGKTGIIRQRYADMKIRGYSVFNVEFADDSKHVLIEEQLERLERD